MNQEAKTTALRMIPHGVYVLTAKSPSGRVAAATVTWVTQTSFEPPLIALGVKVESRTHEVIGEAGCFALNILGRDQQSVAAAFFKHREPEGDEIGGQRFRTGSVGAPILECAPAALECKLARSVEIGDHSTFIAEVVDAHLAAPIEGRPDQRTLKLEDLGPKVFYGG